MLLISNSDCPSNKPPVSAFPNFTQPSGLRVWKNFAAQNSNPVSEDCLKLNVWTKNAGNVKAKKPVMVFLHGGRKYLAERGPKKLPLIDICRLPDPGSPQPALQWPVPGGLTGCSRGHSQVRLPNRT